MEPATSRVLGAVTSVIAAVLVALVVDVESSKSWTRLSGETIDPLALLVLCGLPIGVLFGALLGSVRLAWSRFARASLYITVALPGMAITVPYWPQLALWAVPITLFHAALLARHTEPPPLPIAIVRKS